MTPTELPLLSHGSDVDGYALDTARVLRRYRRRAVPEREVSIMRYARDRGYPAPRVFDVTGSDLVIEIPPPDFLGVEGTAILQLDLHPANVVLGRNGPAVIVQAFLGEFAPAEWRVSLDRAVAYRRADGNVSDKEKERLTRIRL